jgi:hypothetical protein
MEARSGGTTFSAAKTTDGAVRGFSDVIVTRNGYYEWIAISRHAAVVGETLILEFDEGGRSVQLAMCVIESRQVFVDGDARHWIRLRTTDHPPVLFEQQIRRG